MGCPIWDPKRIPLTEPHEADSYIIPLTNHAPVKIHAVSLGNPHAIMLVDNLEQASVDILGPQIEIHPHFPEHANVGFLELNSSGHISLRVHERGTGETRACGSGAAAAAAVGRRFYGLDANIRVSLPGGDMWVSWADTTGSLSLTGPAEFVYEGKLL